MRILHPAVFFRDLGLVPFYVFLFSHLISRLVQGIRVKVSERSPCRQKAYYFLFCGLSCQVNLSWQTVMRTAIIGNFVYAYESMNKGIFRVHLPQKSSSPYIDRQTVGHDEDSSRPGDERGGDKLLSGCRLPVQGKKRTSRQECWLQSGEESLMLSGAYVRDSSSFTLFRHSGQMP